MKRQWGQEMCAYYVERAQREEGWVMVWMRVGGVTLNASLWTKMIHVGQRGYERYGGKINFGSGMDKLATLSGKI